MNDTLSTRCWAQLARLLRLGLLAMLLPSSLQATPHSTTLHSTTPHSTTQHSAAPLPALP